MCLNVVETGDVEILLSGATDGIIKISKLDASGKISAQLSEFNFGITPRSVDYMDDCLLAGFSDGSIKELNL